MAIEEQVAFNEDKPLLFDSISYTLAQDDEKSYLLETPKCDAKALRLDTSFILSDATKSNYRPKVTAKVVVKYKTETIKTDVFFIVINRDSSVSETLYKNSSVLNLKGQDIEEIQIEVKNKSTESIEITGFYLYPSKDAGYYQIVDVLKSPVVAADVLQATASFDAATFTQFFRTNVFALSALEGFGVGGGGTVNYLVAETWNLSFRTAKLDEVATEQFSVWVDYGGRSEQIFFWYAIIGDHPDAYKYLTTVDPNEKYPDITPSERDKFKFLVYKKDTDVEKLVIKFNQVASGATVPTIILGAGVSLDPQSMLGKGEIYKDETGFYLNYYKQDGTGTNGLVMDDEGVYLRGVVNDFEYLDAYDDGFIWKYKGDPRTVAEEVLNSNNDFVGFEVNGVFKPFTRRTGSVKNA